MDTSKVSGGHTKKQFVNKSIVETLKTIVIVAMITGVTMFIVGMNYQKGVEHDKTSAVSNAVSQTASTEKLKR